MTKSEADINDEGNHVRKDIQFKSIRFEVLNTGDISYVMTIMAKDIETQVGNSNLNSSDITIEKTSGHTTNYDKCNPTRAGSYIELPKWLSSKKACIIIKMKITNVSNIVFNALFLKSMRQTILK